MKHGLDINIAIVIICLCLASLMSTQEVAAEELLGVTWEDSKLISFDPHTGEVTATHAQLNPYEDFVALAYDSNHNRLYALSQVDNNLYAIDPVTLKIRHLGNLHIQKDASGGDTGALAYDPMDNRFYTAVMHSQYWQGDYINLRSQLCEINLEDLALRAIGEISGPLIHSFAFNVQDRNLYGLASYGWGSWDSPYKTQVVKIDPTNSLLTELFETPYHVISGFAKKGSENLYYSWINWTSHFYGQIDTENQTVTQLANSDSVDAISALLYKDFPIESNTLPPLEEIPVRFHFTGHVTAVNDPGNMLEGEIAVGNEFSGYFFYDSNAPYKEPDPNMEAPYGASVNINDLTVSMEGFYVEMQNNYFDIWDSDNVYDSFSFTSNWDYASSWITFRLVDNSASALSNNNVLPNHFDLSAWDEQVFFLGQCDGADEEKCYTIHGVVDRIVSDADADGDGIPDDVDTCSNSDLGETVVIGSCNSKVANTLVDDGCTISDLIGQCAVCNQKCHRNHRNFLCCVSRKTNKLKKDGIISRKERAKLLHCAINGL